MTHEEWVKKYTAVLKGNDEAGLRDLLDRTTAKAKTGSSISWRIQQMTQSLAAQREESGDDAEAIALHLKLAEEVETEIRYLECVAGNVLTHAAVAQFRSGDERAAETGKRAFVYHGRTGDPYGFSGELKKLMRESNREHPDDIDSDQGTDRG